MNENDPDQRASLAEFEAGLAEAWPAEAIRLALQAEGMPPADALVASVLLPERIAPEVIAAIEQASRGEALPDETDRLMFRGLYVLGAARYAPACHPVLSLMRKLGDELDEVLGDALDDGLQRVLAGLYDGDAESLEAALVDPAVGMFARESLVGAVTTLASKGRLSRSDAVRLLTRADAALRDEPNDMFWLTWSQAVELLALDELVPAVEQAYADGRIPPEFSSIEDFRKGLNEARLAGHDDSRFERQGFGFIEDIVAELGQFVRTEPDGAASSYADELDTDWASGLHGPVRNPLRNVGRNDPCPCGSGKKYKKCCLDKG